MGEPNLPARQMGRQLKRMRERLGMTQDEAGAPLRMSTSKMSRIEMGYLPPYHDFRALLDRYGVIVSDWDEYISAYDRAKEKGWWHHYGVGNRGFLPIEAEASKVQEFQFGYIPGLLQTEAYMREVFVAARVPMKPKVLENQVAVRLRRQLRLTEEPLLTYHAIIDESTLRRPILYGKARQEQLRNIIERAVLPNVTVQVVAEEVGAYPGQFGSVTVAGFEDPEEPDIAYVEHIIGSVHIEKKDEVSAARLALKDFADRALDEEDSVALIERLCAGG
ncbi:Helix-turn-helix domain-containing protein [Amycolatopsis pretoriensis]|uniref:Helix-turn-helix domain-containing protein n=1 Tax=Amycolatopsis pretoriensis TaxID=218821 RepID=A0A1H5QTL2_9PSEU|nr:helix-turn-helix transcriptional regulator [Amycolatopsis pretoriensis]SEF29482.1 Helix-turn-helix domain-containing protein [Amycolatopsis pretoriensis]